jgi:N-acetylglucosamine-6-sulfatase
VVPPFLAEKKIAGVVLVGDPQPFLLVTADSRNSPAVLTASFRSAAGGELSRIEIRADELDPLHPRPLAGPAGARLQGATRTPADLVFLGDSTTEGWTGAGATVWARRYARRRAAALGFAGAGASTVAARIEEGALDGLSPKLVVLLVGTNDTNGDRTRGRSASARQIADGVLGVVARIRGKLPEAKILLLAIFPRDEGPSPRRNKIAEANRLLAEGADGKNVRFLDLGARFLDKDGKISRDDMPDFVHLSPRGYEIWAEAIEPAVRELLGEK